MSAAMNDMARQTLAKFLTGLEEGTDGRSGPTEPGALTTEQLRDVLREVLSVEPDALAISAMFGRSLAQKASPSGSARK